VREARGEMFTGRGREGGRSERGDVHGTREGKEGGEGR
jgi:hypothetical protein